MTIHIEDTGQHRRIYFVSHMSNVHCNRSEIAFNA